MERPRQTARHSTRRLAGREHGLRNANAIVCLIILEWHGAAEKVEENKSYNIGKPEDSKHVQGSQIGSYVVIASEVRCGCSATDKVDSC